jgi:hypothetical protein
MMRSMLGRLFRRTGGQAMAELALVLPIVLFFLVAIVELGAAFRTYQIVTNGAREGARTGVVPTGTTALVEGTVYDYLTQAGLDRDLAGVVPTCTGPNGACSSGSELQVRVSYDFSFRSMGPVMRLVCGGCGDSWGTVPLTTTSVMRNE